ncbi:MAG: hypothetical protein EAZ62_04890, partial [Sphingobacteriia bacterium]
MKKLIGGLVVATLLSFSLLPGVSAQNSWGYVQAGQTLTQDFNGLPSSGSFAWVGKGPHFLGGVPINASALPGWMAWQLGGSGSNAIFGITTGSATASGVYSVGSSGSSERALGCLASSTGIYAIGTKLVNQSGQTLQELVVELTAEQWRKGGSGNANRWVCKMATGQPGEEALAQWTEVPNLTLRSLHSSTGAVTLNGQLAENKQVLSAQITQVGWLPGNWLMLRWEDMDEAGSDDIMAIDQFQFTAHPGSVPLPTVDSLVALSPSPTRADTVAYGIQFNGNVLGLGPQHFSLVAQGLSGAHLAHVTGEGKSYQASVVTGSGQGYVVLGLAQAAGILPGLQGLPFWSFDTIWVDKKGPVIRTA